MSTLIAVFFAVIPYVLLVIVLLAIGYASHSHNDGRRTNGRINHPG